MLNNSRLKDGHYSKKKNLYLIDLTCSSGLDQLYILIMLNKTKASHSSTCSFFSAFSLDLVSSFNVCRCFCHARACKDNISVCFRWRHKMDDGSLCWSGAGAEDLAALPWGIRGWETCMGDGKQSVMPDLDVILNHFILHPLVQVICFSNQDCVLVLQAAQLWHRFPNLVLESRCRVSSSLLYFTYANASGSNLQPSWSEMGVFEQKKCRTRGTPISRVWKEWSTIKHVNIEVPVLNNSDGHFLVGYWISFTPTKG